MSALGTTARVLLYWRRWLTSPGLAQERCKRQDDWDLAANAVDFLPTYRAHSFLPVLLNRREI
jgi:hypothetical protein